MESAKRDDIIKQAFQVFYAVGFHAAGVDLVLAGSGISKRTLYKHFETKEDLIRATIEFYHALAMATITGYMNRKSARTPVARILGLFDYLEDEVRSGNIKGCYAMNAKSEYANRGAAEIESACDAYATAVEQTVERELRAGKFREAKMRASQITMMFHGAILSSQTKKSVAPVQLARAAAKLLLEQE